MERDGLLHVADDRHLELTEKGRHEAIGVMRKHRLAERLLADVIGLDWEDVHIEACRWEHVMSEAVERRILALLDKPLVCPHGNPIPGLDDLGLPFGATDDHADADHRSPRPAPAASRSRSWSSGSASSCSPTPRLMHRLDRRRDAARASDVAVRRDRRDVGSASTVAERRTSDRPDGQRPRLRPRRLTAPPASA